MARQQRDVLPGIGHVHPGLSRYYLTFVHSYRPAICRFFDMSPEVVSHQLMTKTNTNNLPSRRQNFFDKINKTLNPGKLVINTVAATSYQITIAIHRLRDFALNIKTSKFNASIDTRHEIFEHVGIISMLTDEFLAHRVSNQNPYLHSVR